MQIVSKTLSEDPDQIKRIRKVFWVFVVRVSDNEHILVTMHLQ